jgi:hypothetical protein
MPDEVIEAPAPAAAATTPAPVQAPAAAPVAAPAPVAAAPAAALAEAPAPAKWSDDWRSELAGDDDKLLKRLERMQSPADLAKTIREQDKLIRSGQFSKPLAKDATPEQVNEWRKENGIPEAPEGYDIAMPDGLVFGDAEKPAVDAYLKAMHGTNATPTQVKAGLEAFARFREEEVQQIQELDATERSATEELLREEWGGNFKQEKARIEALFANAPSGVRDLVLNARAGKSGLMNKPEVVQWLAGLAREVNPTATIVPAGGNKEGAIADELKQIKAMRFNADGTENKAYWDPKVQQRERDLLVAQSKASK